MRDFWSAEVSEVGEGYVVRCTSLGERALVVTGPWNPTIESMLSSGSIDILGLNYMHGFREPNLNFIRPWPIERVDMIARWVEDLSPLYALENTVVDLSLEAGPNCSLDLSRFPLLQSVAMPWSYMEATVSEAIGLRRLFSHGYRAKNLEPLSALHGLEALEMKHYPRIESLEGLDSLPGLRDLQIYDSSRLTDISSLRRGGRLTRLALDSCRKIDNLEDIADLTNLKVLKVSNCGYIDSIQQLNNFKLLEVLFMTDSTNIVDGDLRPLLDLSHLRYLAMAIRRHYVPSVQEIRVDLGLTS